MIVNSAWIGVKTIKIDFGFNDFNSIFEKFLGYIEFFEPLFSIN